MDVANLIVAVAVLIGTGVLIALTVLLVLPKRPSLRLDQLRLAAYRHNGTFAAPGESAPVTLVFVNDGPGIAPALNAYVTGTMTGSSEEFQFPADGSPTVAVGERFEVEVNVKILEGHEGFVPRRYMQGDDYFFDLTGVSIRFEWGVPDKRRSSKVENLHQSQQNASPQVESPPAGWVAFTPSAEMLPSSD